MPTSATAVVESAEMPAGGGGGGSGEVLGERTVSTADVATATATIEKLGATGMNERILLRGMRSASETGAEKAASTAPPPAPSHTPDAAACTAALLQSKLMRSPYPRAE